MIHIVNLNCSLAIHLKCCCIGNRVNIFLELNVYCSRIRKSKGKFCLCINCGICSVLHMCNILTQLAVKSKFFYQMYFTNCLPDAQIFSPISGLVLCYLFNSMHLNWSFRHGHCWFHLDCSYIILLALIMVLVRCKPVSNLYPFSLTTAVFLTQLIQSLYLNDFSSGNWI